MAEQTTTPEPPQQEAPSPTLERQYHLVLLNDDDHTYQYVIEMLGAVLGYQPEKAFAIACVVDSEGRATVETATHEEVARHQRQIHSYGPDPRVRRCRGSMSAIVEPTR
ncbi:MAG: ATP-dependent Clp protease adaptor ClpS [Dehalococcoidia bacterium]